MKILDVPFFDQKDNGPDGWRQCQTSSIAMCLNYIGLKNIKDDTDYLRVVRQYGDTTAQATHTQAMKALGVGTAYFSTTLTKQNLINQIDNDFPKMFFNNICHQKAFLQFLVGTKTLDM